MLNLIRPALVMTLLFTAVTGLLYPLAVTGLAQALLPGAANGSLVRDAGGSIRGSYLIAQAFSGPGYLHPRPSSAGDAGYDGANSSGSNLGPMDPKLAQRVAAAAGALAGDAPGVVIPADAVTASASGLDPDVSPQNAARQAPRIARARQAPLATVLAAIRIGYEGPALGFIGQPRVNVVRANRALDALAPPGPPRRG